MATEEEDVITTGESTGVVEEGEDLISKLPDGVLGDIVSLLPTKDGGRTRVLSSRWRPLWRTAPLNLDLGYLTGGRRHLTAGRISRRISRILATHSGPGRRFSVPLQCILDLGGRHAAALDGWLRSPALAGLQEIEFHLGLPRWQIPPPPLPAPVRRFSATLRVASFGGCAFPDANTTGGGELRLPVLEKLSLVDVRISEGALHGLLAGCRVLESLLMGDNHGCSLVRIVSPSIRSIGVRPGPGEIKMQQLVIEDAPCLERLLLLGGSGFSMGMVIKVIRAPRLHALGQLSAYGPKLEFGTTVFQGSQIVSAAEMVHSVKVLAITQFDLSLEVAINFLKCFPSLEKLYIKTTAEGEKNDWRDKYMDLTGTLDICLKELVLTNYQAGNKSHINFVKFFMLNARVLQSMRLELHHGIPSSSWIKKQHRLLKTKHKASKDAQLDFVTHSISLPFFLGRVCTQHVHELATADPFVGSHDWM